MPSNYASIRFPSPDSLLGAVRYIDLNPFLQPLSCCDRTWLHELTSVVLIDNLIHFFLSLLLGPPHRNPLLVRFALPSLWINGSPKGLEELPVSGCNPPTKLTAVGSITPAQLRLLENQCEQLHCPNQDGLISLSKSGIDEYNLLIKNALSR